MPNSRSMREAGSTSAVAFRKPRPGEMPYYELADNQLSHGASFGNKKIWVDTKATGAIERVFSNSAGKSLLGSIVITYALPSKILITSSPEAQCLQAPGINYVLAEQDGIGTMEIYPFEQRHIFELSGELHVEETVLVPKEVEDDPCAVLQHIKVTNLSGDDAMLLISVYADLRGDMGEDMVVEFNERLSALIAYNESNPNFARLIGVEGCEVAYQTTHDVSEGYAGAYTKRVDTSHVGPEPIGQLQLELPVGNGQSASTTITAAVSSDGVLQLKDALRRTEDFDGIFRATMQTLNPAAAVSSVETPDPIINQGVFWAKVNMMKVMAAYPEGQAFTNEPGVSTNVVGRDVAWFVYGCDFLDPDFSRRMLVKFAEKQYGSGKIPEYYNALDGRVEDYGISMNDDTPLFVLACCHHYFSTHNRAFLEEIFPSIRKTLDYILSQRDDRGLVISRADGYDVWGIASWRNVIPGYQLNGAVTEINSECYAALSLGAQIARAFGDEDATARFEQGAWELKSAMNSFLLNLETGLYYLNIDMSGRIHTDVTADEIFPVLFNAAPQNVNCRIVSRLRADDFFTSAGLRTVPRNSPDYEPTKLIGLRGGVWPGVAFWYAMAAQCMNPEFMTDALHASYLQYLLDPLKNNTVPGQFSEWFDGESLVNRGMRLSPWEPPRLLWAAVEGLCGAQPWAAEGLEIDPTRPAGWQWLALRRMPCPGGDLTFFAAFTDSEIRIYANMQVKTPHSLHLAGADVTRYVHAHDYRVHRVAFAREDGLVICVGSEAEVYLTAILTLTGLLDESTPYRISVYGRSLGEVDLGVRIGADLSEIAVSIEDGGFRVITIRPRSSQAG